MSAGLWAFSKTASTAALFSHQGRRAAGITQTTFGFASHLRHPM